MAWIGVHTIDRKCLDKRNVSKTADPMGMIDIAATPPARGGYVLKFLERNSSASVMVGKGDGDSVAIGDERVLATRKSKALG